MKIKPVNNNPILIVDPDSPTAWMAEGNCRMYPPDMFFPSDGAGVERAKKVCADCPVASQCLEHALDARIDHGVWGGTSERQRRRILRERPSSRAARAPTLSSTTLGVGQARTSGPKADRDC